MKSLLAKIISVLVIGVLTVSLCACNPTSSNNENCDGSHLFIDYSYTAPTCKTNGEKTQKCSRCGFIETETLLLIHHDYQEKTATPSSCTTHGSKTYECTMCHETKIEQLPLTKHDYKLVNATASTCVIHGSKQYKCNDCNKSYSEELPFAEHTYKTETKEATCFTRGGTVEKCSVCGDEKYINETPLLAHEFGAEGYCAKCGIYETLFNADGLNLKRAQLSDCRWGIWGNLPQKFNIENKNIPLTYWKGYTVKMTITLYNQHSTALGSVYFLSDTTLSSGEMRISNMRTSGNYAKANTFSIDFAKIGSLTDKQFAGCTSFKIELACDGYKKIEKIYTV